MYPSTDERSIRDIDEVNLEKCLSPQLKHHYVKLCDTLYQKYQKINIIKSIASTVENQSQSQSQSENINISISEKISQLDPNLERIELYKNNNHTIENIKLSNLPTTIFIANKVNISDQNIFIYSIELESNNEIISIVIDISQMFQIFATLSENINEGSLYTSRGILVISNPNNFHIDHSDFIKKNHNFLKKRGLHRLENKKHKYQIPDIIMIDEDPHMHIYESYIDSTKTIITDPEKSFDNMFNKIKKNNINCHERINKLLDLLLDKSYTRTNSMQKSGIFEILEDIQDCIADGKIDISNYNIISDKLCNIPTDVQELKDYIIKIDNENIDKLFNY